MKHKVIAPTEKLEVTTQVINLIKDAEWSYRAIDYYENPYREVSFFGLALRTKYVVGKPSLSLYVPFLLNGVKFKVEEFYLSLDLYK